MAVAEFEKVSGTFAGFHGVFARFFGRTETRRRSEQYLRGLLIKQTDRRNAENVAEAVREATPRSLQRLLTDAPWETRPVLDALQGYLAPWLNAADGVFVLDETGFPNECQRGPATGASRPEHSWLRERPRPTPLPSGPRAWIKLPSRL
jgi:SRSO17 transposase